MGYPLPRMGHPLASMSCPMPSMCQFGQHGAPFTKHVTFYPAWVTLWPSCLAQCLVWVSLASMWHLLPSMFCPMFNMGHNLASMGYLGRLVILQPARGTHYPAWVSLQAVWGTYYQAWGHSSSRIGPASHPHPPPFLRPGFNFTHHKTKVYHWGLYHLASKHSLSSDERRSSLL